MLEHPSHSMLRSTRSRFEGQHRKCLPTCKPPPHGQLRQWPSPCGHALLLGSGVDLILPITCSSASDPRIESQYTNGITGVGVSDNAACVKPFLSTLQHALGEERHFALLEGVPNPTKTPLPISCKSNSAHEVFLLPS